FITRNALPTMFCLMTLAVVMGPSMTRAQSRFQTPVKDIVIIVAEEPTGTATSRHIKVRMTGDKKWELENPENKDQVVTLAEIRRGEDSIDLFAKESGIAVQVDLAAARLKLGKADASGLGAWLSDSSQSPESEFSIILAGDKSFSPGQ
ncbi:MAG: hypothetical protein KDM64_00400, partial [Verrucomicrobiae bacterium]|nr:hypothetical protein [Verrucomicrobiae bacterium]